MFVIKHDILEFTGMFDNVDEGREAELHSNINGIRLDIFIIILDDIGMVTVPEDTDFVVGQGGNLLGDAFDGDSTAP